MTNEYKMAALVCDHSLKIVKDDLVVIRGEAIAEPLIRACAREVLKRGAHPLVRMSYNEQNADLFKYGSDHQFGYIPDIDRLQAETVTAQISIESSGNSKQLTGANPADVAVFQKARGDLREVMFAREAEGKYRWIIAPYPTAAMAQEAEMSFEDYAAFVYAACKLDCADPIKAWHDVATRQAGIAARLQGSKTIHIRGKRTDLTLNVEGRLWKSCSGDRNMPDGEIFTSPVEDSAHGEMFFDMPTTYNGVEAANVYLRFEHGKVVEARADKGEDFLLKMLEVDEGARFVGEIAFGMNETIIKPTRNILFDEKIGRSMHLAIGASYPETGGKNKSALHWDLIKNMRENSTVELDGVEIYRNGEFL